MTAPPGPSPRPTWHRPEWHDDALCVRVTHIASGERINFFPERGESVVAAKDLCARCPVCVECLTDALAHGEKFGIFGCSSERERRNLRRRMARATPELVAGRFYREVVMQRRRRLAHGGPVNPEPDDPNLRVCDACDGLMRQDTRQRWYCPECRRRMISRTTAQLHKEAG